jgi:hypothetical protein
LDKCIIPSTYKDRALLPNLFLELKGPKGGLEEIRLQMTQDLAASARAMHCLKSYCEDRPAYDGRADAFGATYYAASETLRLYTVLCAPGSYHVVRLKGYILTDDLDAYRAGVTAFRNLRDLAREERDALISRATEVARAQGQGLHRRGGGRGRGRGRPRPGSGAGEVCGLALEGGSGVPSSSVGEAVEAAVGLADPSSLQAGGRGACWRLWQSSYGEDVGVRPPAKWRVEEPVMLSSGKAGAVEGRGCVTM